MKLISNSTDKSGNTFNSDQIQYLLSASIRASLSYLLPKNLIAEYCEDRVVELDIRELVTKKEAKLTWLEFAVNDSESMRKLKISEMNDLESPIIFITSFSDTNVYMWEKNKTLFISIRGTSSWQDVRQSLKIFPVKYKTKSGIVMVHKGFLEGFLTAEKDMTNIIENSSVNKIVFASHSLGGSVSQIAAAFYGEKYPNKNVECITFGCPRTGDSRFVEWFSKNVRKNMRVVNYRDPISMIPNRYYWRHTFNSCLILNVDQLVNVFVDVPWYQILITRWNLSEHNTQLYISRLHKLFQLQVQ